MANYRRSVHSWFIPVNKDNLIFYLHSCEIGICSCVSHKRSEIHRTNIKLRNYFNTQVFLYQDLCACFCKRMETQEWASKRGEVKMEVIICLNVPLSHLYPETQKTFYNLKHGLSQCKSARIGVC
jgi:hypothetical protein